MKRLSVASAATSRWRTPTAFGVPVEPEVNITYASRSGSAGGSAGAPAGSAVRAAITSSAVSRAVTPAWSSRVRRRSSGARPSTGTYAPPALSTASCATTSAAERSMNSATRSSGARPSAVSRWATRSDQSAS